MEKDKASFIRSVILCFNPNFYPVVLRQSGWRSFLYLVLICLIVYGVLGYRGATVLFDEHEKRLAGLYEKALPDFHFENGQADYPPDKPHVYEERDGDNVFAVVVDTSGKSTELDKKYPAGLLITKTELVIKDDRRGETRRQIPKTTKKVLAREFFIERMRSQRPRAILTETFNFSLFNLIGKAILIAMVAGVLLLADKGKMDAYPYAYYFNVGCYAVTPFVLSAFARGWQSGSFLTYASYGASLMLFLLLAVLGLAKCRQEDARELLLAETQAENERLDQHG